LSNTASAAYGGPANDCDPIVINNEVPDVDINVGKDADVDDVGKGVDDVGKDVDDVADVDRDVAVEKDVANKYTSSIRSAAVASQNIEPYAIHGPPCVLKLPTGAPKFMFANWKSMIRYQPLGAEFGSAVSDWLAYEATGDAKVCF
jgi:hypothetical protein